MARLAVVIRLALLASAGALQLPAARPSLQPAARRCCTPRLGLEQPARGEDSLQLPEESMPSAFPEDIANPVEAFPVVPDAPAEPVRPTSSMGFKLKGLGAIFLFLVVSGFSMNYAFSPSSPLLKSDEPQVNQGMIKYAAPLSKASGMDD